MNYHVDWIGAIGAGATAAIVFYAVRTAFPRLKGAGFYLVVGLLVAALSLGLRELVRHFGI